MRCIVVGCGKYSVTSRGFIILPKNLDRAKKWLEAAGVEITSEELSSMLSGKQRSRMKFCKRHFLPTSFLNQKIAEDAVPRLYLPNPEQSSHHGVLCNKCKTVISGVRYKCVTCEDFDLCRDCENKNEHQEHDMLRISKPISTIAAEDLVTKMRQQSIGTKEARSTSTTHLSIEPTTVMSIEPENKEISSDDEPITKYIYSNNYEHDLPEEEKTKICNEVDRVLSIINKSFVAQKRMNNPAQCSQTFNISTQTIEHDFYPEVEFADVNDTDFQGDVKNEDDLDMAPESVPELIASSELFD